MSTALRHSILKRAVSGQLVTQDPSDESASLLLERIRTEREKNSGVRKKNKNSSKEEAA
jgi:type I restriction enzyme S subunit